MLDWKSLISEDNGNTLSLGRVAFWIALLYSTYFWFHPYNVPYPPALLEFLYATLAYNLGSKGINTYHNVKTTIAGFTSNCFSGNSNSSPMNSSQQSIVGSNKTDDIDDDDIANTRKP